MRFLNYYSMCWVSHSKPPALRLKHQVYSVCIALWQSSPSTDKRAPHWPAVIKLGSAAGAAEPGCRHGCSKAAASLLTALEFRRLRTSRHKAQLEHNLWSTLSAGAHTLYVHTHMSSLTYCMLRLWGARSGTGKHTNAPTSCTTGHSCNECYRN